MILRANKLLQARLKIKKRRVMAMFVTKMKDILEICNSWMKKIRSTNLDMKNYIDSFHNKSERLLEYP